MELNHLEQAAKTTIDEAVRINGPVIMMVDGFQTDEEALMLRDMLWYARNCGVEVRIIPKNKK